MTTIKKDISFTCDRSKSIHILKLNLLNMLFIRSINESFKRSFINLCFIKLTKFTDFIAFYLILHYRGFRTPWSHVKKIIHVYARIDVNYQSGGHNNQNDLFIFLKDKFSTRNISRDSNCYKYNKQVEHLTGLSYLMSLTLAYIW